MCHIGCSLPNHPDKSKQGGKMKKFDFEWMAKLAIIAALYVVLTLISYPFSYNAIQFRISEALMLLCFYNKKYTTSFVIGCVIANLFSFNIIDCLIGSIATLISGVIMSKIKNRIISSFIPVIFNAMIVGIELYLYLKMPLLYGIVSVGIGEFVVVVIIGNIIFHFIEKNQTIMARIGLK